LDGEPARVQSREVEQIGGELRQPRNLFVHRGEELPPGRLVQLLIRQQLQEAAEREERRAQLMRGVRDEFAPRVVQLRKANAHALERVGKPAQLPAARVAHGRVEAPARDPVGSPLEPPNAARKEPCTPVAKQQGDQQGSTRGDQQAALHLMDARKLVLERVGQKESGRTARHEDGRLRVAPVAPFHRPALGALPEQRADGDRVGLDVLGQRRAA